METEFIALISQVGFPIAITCWFMFRTEKIISENTKATQDLMWALADLKKK
ncbi:MAG: YvrJ family protein [Bacteroidetes bacterium]|nr:YvrJ family protein [Bacteroidota bacterium]